MLDGQRVLDVVKTQEYRKSPQKVLCSHDLRRGGRIYSVHRNLAAQEKKKRGESSSTKTQRRRKKRPTEVQRCGF